MNSLRLALVLFLFSSFSVFPTSVDAQNDFSTRKLGGLYSRVNLEILPPTPDAKLLGIDQAMLAATMKAAIRKHNLKPETREKTKAILSLQTTTVDVGPQIVTYVHLKLLEIGKLKRMKNRRFVTTWDKGKLTVSNALKHPKSVQRAIREMVEAYVKASLQ